MRSFMFVVLMAQLACGEGEQTDTSNQGADTIPEAVDCSVATNWTTVGAPFIYTWCTPCHSPTLESAADRQGAYPHVNFGTYEDVITHSERLEAVIFGATATMPPGGGPSADELTAMDAWIECGLPE